LKKSFKALIIVIAISSITLFPQFSIRNTNIAFANPETTLQLVNPVDGSHLFNFTTSQKAVGDTFLINVTVTDVQDLFAWQIKVTWDPELLEFVERILPPDHVFAGKSYLETPVITEPGVIAYGITLGPGQKSVNVARGTLVQLKLKIIKGVYPGQKVKCNIEFIELGDNTFLLNTIGGVIPITPINAQYEYSAPWVPPPPATIKITPQRIVDPTLTVGTSFNVSLVIKNSTQVNQWKVKIIYDKNIINATAVYEGDFLKSAGPTAFEYTINIYNESFNMLQMTCSLTIDAGVNGDGELAKITFLVNGNGSSHIKIVEAELLNPIGISLPFNKVDGYFSNILVASLRVEPNEVRGPEYVPGTTFYINITLSNVENLKICVFNLTYNPTILQEINILILPVAGQMPIKKLIVDDISGYIYVILTYKQSVTVYGSISIMKVDFEVQSLGITPINLTQTSMLNIDGQAIAHEVYHGIFIGLIRDVAITNLYPDITVAYEGWVVKIFVTVKNKGNLTETIQVKIYANQTLIQSINVTELLPAEEETITVIWDTKNFQPCKFYTIRSEIPPVPYELNIMDNTLENGSVKIRLMGDVDGNGIVNMTDIVTLIQHFRTYSGHPLWDPLLDLDRNLLIDIRDVVTAILNFLRQC